MHLDPLVLDRRAAILAHVAELVDAGATADAAAYARAHFPFTPIPTRRGLAKELGLGPRARETIARVRRKSLSPGRRSRIWLRDRYHDRYLGCRLVHPAALELLSILLPVELPYDNPPHGRYEATHRCMWELWPAIDHVVPIAGASDDTVHGDDNLVTTSALVNQLKSDYGLASLGWRLLPVADANQGWDGLSGWFLRYFERHPAVESVPGIGPRLRGWARVISTPV